jgi:calmodulin
LTKDEIKQAVGKSLSSKEIDELLKQADTNHDGKVDYEEFFKRFFSK